MRRRLGLLVAAAATVLATPAVLPPQADAAPASAPVSTFITSRPWSSTGALRVHAVVTTAPAGSFCNSSNTTGRTDAYRCYLGGPKGVTLLLDPAFKSPTSSSIAWLDGTTWRVYRRISAFHQGPASAASIWRVRLANGAICTAASGAGPNALPKYPNWVGVCSGGPYRAGWAYWRATIDDHKNANFPLLALNSARTRWVAAVEYPAGSGIVRLQPVVTALR